MPLEHKTAGIELREIAERVHARIIGDPSLTVSTISSLEEPRAEALSFYRGSSLQNLTGQLTTESIRAVLVHEALELDEPLEGKAFLKVKDPFHAFVTLLPLFFKPDVPSYGIHPQACIDPRAEISPSAQIGPFSYVGPEAVIEDNVVLHPHVTIYPRARIGASTVIHSGAHIREDVHIEPGVIIQNGAIIGADGFGYLPDPEKGLIPVPQIGNVTLASGVEIGANTCIDRATLGSTKIGMGTKIDNLVQIGHNTRIGNFSIVCGQSAIAGSAKIGNQVVLGGNAGVADHTEITDGCRFGAFSGLHGKYETKGDYAGNPAMPARTYRRVVACIPKLPELFRKVASR
jgi:UDP-3-O-[3-hydroxymyristoyl] glucosamine N-acyltransferase